MKYFWYGPLAQLVEQLTLNQRVAGSSPHGPLGAKPTEQVNVGAKAFRKHLCCSIFCLSLFYHLEKMHQGFLLHC